MNEVEGEQVAGMVAMEGVFQAEVVLMLKVVVQKAEGEVEVEGVFQAEEAQKIRVVEQQAGRTFGQSAVLEVAVSVPMESQKQV